VASRPGAIFPKSVRERPLRRRICLGANDAPQPMPESCLLTGPLEPTNEWYAIAKIAGLKLCQA
jgi:hypothetical protein